MEYRFYLNDLEIEEPRGWADFELSMKRDDKYHGIQFEASTGTLSFYGDAAIYLMDQKAEFGINANVTFIVQISCDTEFEEIFRGRLNFGRYKDTCGFLCEVSLPVEEDSCSVIFNSRFDQKVDMDSLTAFDGITVLPNYANMGQPITLHAKALDVRTEGLVSADGDAINLPNEESLSAYFYIRPIYEREIFNSIDTGQVKDVISNIGKNDTGPATAISPQLLFEDNGTCFSSEFEYEIRLKGNFNIAGGNNDFFNAKLRFLEYLPTDDDISLGNDSTVLNEYTIVNFPGGTESFPQAYSYDQTFIGTFTAKDGYGYYAILQLALNPGDYDIENLFDPETYILIRNTKLCPDTTAKSYLLHESLSRVTEAVTNRCMRAKSEYYGRIDSEPFSFDTDGCGGLRMITSGLKIRQAPEDKFFASPKDILDGVRAIDNIGFGIEDDPDLPGKLVLRTEPVEYFYRDDEIMIIDAIPEGSSEIQENMHYSKALVGYNNWKVERVNGLDEPNSTREYRTGLETINNSLDIKSDLITGSYPIEITRQQSFAQTGAADTRYDDNTFLICLERDAYGFIVEQGNITSPANIFDPNTLYNFRLTPVRNLMRWYKSIINSYPVITNSSSKLFFSAGTGNLIAEGKITEGIYDDPCSLESMVISESQNLFITHFEDQAEATPLWKNETITFEYPLSVAEYQALKVNPYGYITYTCGNGGSEKGFIKEIKFRPAKGTATFTLIKKWVA